jgi:dTMP kinase
MKGDMKTHKGLLISFEGMEGAGKTTQCELLEKKLKKVGHKTMVVREPGGVSVSEQIREVVLSPKNPEVAVTTEVLLFQAARAQLYAEKILPHLQKGGSVLMDRTRDSSTIYQGMVRGIGVKWIEQLNDYSTQNTLPDITFLLDLPAEEGMDRRRKMGMLDRIEQEGVAFQEKVCAAYLKVARADKTGRWVIIDGMKSLEQVEKEIWEVVSKRIK